MPNKYRYLLGYPIQKLPFSRRLKKIFADAGIVSLNQLLKIPYYKWDKKLPGLTRKYRHDIVIFLLKTQLDEYLKID